MFFYKILQDCLNDFTHKKYMFFYKILQDCLNDFTHKKYMVFYQILQDCLNDFTHKKCMFFYIRTIAHHYDWLNDFTPYYLADMFN